MSSPIGNKKNVKIFVLYLMQNVGYPMDFITVNEVVMQTDFVAYLDFAESFHEMLDDGLLEEATINRDGDPCYRVTDKGACVVETMQGDLLPSILEEALACALRFLDFRRRGVKVSCHTEKDPTGGFAFCCTMTEKERTLLSVRLWVDSEARAKQMEEQFRGRPENIYRGVTALLSGNVNYLFDDRSYRG